MDTHLIDRPDVQHSDTRAEIQVPDDDRLVAERSLLEGEVERSSLESRANDDAASAVPGLEAAGAAPQPAKTQRKRAKPLVPAAVGVVGVLAVGLLVSSSFSPFRSPTSTSTRVVLLSHPAPSVLAPAASLASAPTPRPVERTEMPTTGTSGGDDMASFLQYGGHPPPDNRTSVGVNTGDTGRSKAIAAAASALSKPVPAPVAVASLAKPAELPPVTVSQEALPKPVVAVPHDPVAATLALQPAKMTDAQQLQVLQLVTELGTLVRDQRTELQQLQRDEQSLKTTVADSLSDFGRRLTLAEARGAIAAAMGAPTTTAISEGRVATATVLPAAARTAARPLVVQAADTGEHRYHVQAASPGLAMLSELDTSGGEERQLPISPGDDLPGYGRVVSIAQRGVTWVVRTEHGIIQ